MSLIPGRVRTTGKPDKKYRLVFDANKPNIFRGQAFGPFLIIFKARLVIGTRLSGLIGFGVEQSALKVNSDNEKHCGHSQLFHYQLLQDLHQGSLL